MKKLVLLGFVLSLFLQTNLASADQLAPPGSAVYQDAISTGSAGELGTFDGDRGEKSSVDSIKISGSGGSLNTGNVIKLVGATTAKIVGVVGAAAATAGIVLAVVNPGTAIAIPLVIGGGVAVGVVLIGTALFNKLF